MKYGFLNIKDRVMMIEDQGPGSALAPGMLDSVSSFAEKAGLPDMNVTLNYENPTNNGIALVTKAVMYNDIQDMNDPESELTDEEVAAINDILYNPGYAPMERLVRAFAYSSVDPYTADPEMYVVDFANDLERLAFAICPKMFLISTFETSTPIFDDGGSQFLPSF